MRALWMSGVLACIGGLVACSVPDVVFTSGDAAADDADNGDDASTDASPGTNPGQDGMVPQAAPMPGPSGCPMHPPMGAQGCCGPTPCVGPGCTMQCPACETCTATGQVCCVSSNQGGNDDKKHAGVTVSCAPQPVSCGKS